LGAVLVQRRGHTLAGRRLRIGSGSECQMRAMSRAYNSRRRTRITQQVSLHCVAATVLALATLALPASALAPPGRYTLPAEGTVYDTRTQLTWERLGSSTSAAPEPYCAGLKLAGGGWRVPTRAEMMSLIDLTTPSTPWIDQNFFSVSTGRVYCTSSKWRVDFDRASLTDQSPCYVRCVR
jgi:hypothetical protein